MNSLYLKYKEDRINARLLSDLKNHNWLINKVSKKKASPVESESPPKPKESLLVSLPIEMEHTTATMPPRTITPSHVLASSPDSERFIKICKTANITEPPTGEMANEDVIFKVPKLTDTRSCPVIGRAKATPNLPLPPQLRMIRHNPTAKTPVCNSDGLTWGKTTSKLPIVPLTPGTLTSKPPIDTISTASNTSISPIVTSNILVRNGRITDSKIRASTTNTVKSVTVNNLGKESNISLKHKLPVTTIPTKATYNIVPRLDYAGIEVNKRIKVRTEASAQTDKVFIGTEDEFNMLDVITSSGLTREELKKAVDNHRKHIDKINKAATVIIDLDKDDENNNANQQMLNMALFHSRNNKNLLLSEMQNYNNSNTISEERPTRAGTPFPFTIPPPPPPLPPDAVSVQHIEVAKLLKHMASKIVALTKELRSPTILTVDENTQTDNTEHNKKQKKQPDTSNEKDTDMDHYNNLRSLGQYRPQTMLVQRNEHWKQLHQQQQYLQQLQQPQMQHQSSQHLSPLQILQIQVDQSMYQQPYSEGHQAPQNEMTYRQQQHLVPQESQQHIQYPPNNYRLHQMTSKNTKQQQNSHARLLFPGDPRSQTAQHYGLSGNIQHGPRFMSTYEANMRSAQPNRRPSYETQYQQYYQNQYWQQQ